MASKDQWDFECPQFVDFAAGLNDKDDSFFDDSLGCKNFKTPVKQTEFVKSHGLPKFGCSSEIFQHEADSRKGLSNKVVTAFSQTKIATKSEVKKPDLATKSDMKTHTASKTVLYCSSKRPVRRRSKSESSINPRCLEVLTKQQVDFDIMPRRSSSVIELRQKKKYTQATTPMCLKRTLVKANVKKAKTSEEIELEKIAQLQQELINHLKYNEMTLKRLRLKQKSQATQKPVPSVKEPTTKETIKKNTKRDINLLAGPLKMIRQELRLNQRDIVENARLLFVEKVTSTPQCFEKPLPVKEKTVANNVSTSSCSSVNHAEKTVVESCLKRPQTMKKYDLHTGLILREKPRNNTLIKPFSFDMKPKDVKIMRNECEKIKAQLPNFLSASQSRNKAKENIPFIKSSSCSSIDENKSTKVAGNNILHSGSAKKNSNK